MKKLLVVLNAVALPTAIILSTGYKPLPDDEKKAFTDVFMKYVSSSFYTDDYRQAFADLRSAKAKKDKDNPESQYDATLLLPGKTEGIINYVQADKKANAVFISTHKQSADAKSDFDQNAAWIDEALGSMYIKKEINHESNENPAHFLYFYSSTADTSNKYAFHVEVAYLYNGYSKKYESEVVIYSQKKN